MVEATVEAMVEATVIHTVEPRMLVAFLFLLFDQTKCQEGQEATEVDTAAMVATAAAMVDKVATEVHTAKEVDMAKEDTARDFNFRVDTDSVSWSSPTQATLA